ncbi:MAG: SDR family oxidoreductase [Chloroflexi bacterium]|nr:SDR family oxidoreductase [Chloroflexota bacterium]
MKALITGAAGFVGANLVRHALVQDLQVKALLSRNGDTHNLLGLDVEIVRGDIRDRDAIARAMRGCDTVFHLAALYSTDSEAARHMYDVNINGTRIVMEEALRADVHVAVHTSTIGTIGRPPDGDLPDETTEFNLWDTTTDYAKSKYLGELAALEFCRRGLHVVVVHPCAPLGAYDFKPTATGQRIVDYLNGTPPSFVEGGINFVAVHDVAAGHLLAAQRGRPGERYILGNTNLSLSEFLTLLEHVSGQQPPRAWRRNPLARSLDILRSLKRTHTGRSRALTCETSKAIMELGLPQTSLNVAVQEAVEWFRKNGYVTRERD